MKRFQRVFLRRDTTATYYVKRKGTINVGANTEGTVIGHYNASPIVQFDGLARLVTVPVEALAVSEVQHIRE